MAEKDEKKLTDNDVVSRDDDMTINAPAEPEAAPTPEPQAQPAPQLIKMNMGGRELEVTPEVAEAYMEDMRYMQQQSASRQADNELAEPAAEQPNYAELMFSDPDAYTKAIREEIVEEVRREYQQDQGMKDFWVDFYRDNPELREDESIVTATLSRYWNDLANMPTGQAKDRLAELTQKQLLSIAQRHGTKPAKNDTATLEGGDNPNNSPTPEPQEAPEDKLPQSLGDALKERKLKRAQAARAAGAG
jgi:hypothetical protein